MLPEFGCIENCRHTNLPEIISNVINSVQVFPKVFKLLNGCPVAKVT